MLTREDCILRAENAERLAEGSDTEATREAFIALARKWRALAGDARPLDRSVKARRPNQSDMQDGAGTDLGRAGEL